MKAVLFDLDDTLYPESTFVESGLRAVADYLAHHHALDAREVQCRMWTHLRTEGRGQVFDRLLQEYKLLSPARVQALVLIYRSHRPVISLPPESIRVLEKIRRWDVKIGLVTDGLASVQQNKITVLGLDRWLDVMVCTDVLGKDFAKPSLRPFEVALDMLGVHPRAAAYVADDPSKDFIAPNRLGMISIRVRTTGLVGVTHHEPGTGRDQAQWEVDHLEQVLPILQENLHD